MGLYGGIESGGTKFFCIVGSSPEHIVAELRIPTTTPEETIQGVVEFFKPLTNTGVLTAIGIASFGPLDLNPKSSTFGFITTTPKPGWHNIDLLGQIKYRLNLPAIIDTDVNAAAFGEMFWNKDQNSSDPFLYMTVGTGIGIGAVINGEPLHGLVHAEGGHMFIPHDTQNDAFPGVCPYHGDCLEGLASGNAMKSRWGRNPEELPEDHIGWDLEAEYLSTALINLVYVYSPQQIVLGGGVMQHKGLIDMVKAKVRARNEGYVHSYMLEEKIGEYIHLPILGNRSGALGAMAMAIKMLEER